MRYLEELFKSVINIANRVDTVQHSHAGSIYFDFKSPSLSGNQDFILVDISDTANYKHDGTDYLHLEWLRLHVDSDNNGEYDVEIGFIEDIDGVNAEFYPIANAFGTKSAGNVHDIIIPFYPNGPKCKSDSLVTKVKSADIRFNTATNLGTTLDSSVANTTPGNRDLVLRGTVTAGNIIVSVEGSYHSH